MRALDLEGIEQGDDVFDQRVEFVGAFGRVGFAVAALIVAKDLETLAKRRRLLVPHRKIGRERIGKRHPGRAPFPVELAVELNAVGLDSHGFKPSRNRSRAPKALRATSSA